MKDYKLLFVLGIVVLITPFLGIPEMFRNWIFVIVAVVLVSMSLFVRSANKEKSVENTESVVQKQEPVVVQEEIKVQPEVLEEAEVVEENLIREDNE
jgi:energy-converting hydrogenase Eha subunit H